MRRRYIIQAMLFGLIGSIVSTSVMAAPPWGQLLPFHRVEADPTKSYQLTKDIGPWMIIGATFTGDRAREQAHELVLELRKEHGLEAWLTKKRFDLTGAQVGKGYTPEGKPKMMRHMRYEKYDEYAVVIGQYEEFDSADAQATLARIKTMRPKCLDLHKRQISHQNMAILREFQRVLASTARPEVNKLGPMRVAFISRNPLVPVDEAQNTLDPLVVKMNRGVEHSLLTCPGKFSVKVATFRGETTMDPKRIEELRKQGIGGLGESKLAIAAAQAGALTAALRKRGVEAYEFHDRHESIVAVGSFDMVGTPRKDGKTEINPQIHAIMQSYGAEKKPIPGTQVSGFSPQSWNGIPFDIQPVPIQVPVAGEEVSRSPLSWLR